MKTLSTLILLFAVLPSGFSAGLRDVVALAGAGPEQVAKAVDRFDYKGPGKSTPVEVAGVGKYTFSFSADGRLMSISFRFNKPRPASEVEAVLRLNYGLREFMTESARVESMAGVSFRNPGKIVRTINLSGKEKMLVDSFGVFFDVPWKAGF